MFFTKERSSAKRDMRAANTYEQWLTAARRLDALDGADEWIRQESSPLYDAELLEERILEFDTLRRKGDVPGLIKALEDGLYRHHHDIINPALYRETYSGESKELPREFLREAATSLWYLKELTIDGLDPRKKLAQFEKAFKNFGRSALMLSGGATMGIYHLGVVKALHDTGLLPRVISGSSMGAIVAAGLCTRTREERNEFFSHPERIHKAALRLKGILSIFRERSLFSTDQLLEHITTNLAGDLTFEEAYKRSGLVLNISVSPTRSRQKPKVLNYLTAPNLLISHSTAASCSMPVLFKPGILMERGEDQEPTPYLPTERWVDGTLGGDLPMARVSRLHNVNHYIVSQTNPHIYPLLSKSEQPGLAWLGFDVLGSLARSQVRTLLGSARKYLTDRTTPQLLEQLYTITAQPYVGDINIHPRIDPFMLRKVLANPTMEDIFTFIREGERVTWPKIAMIHDHTLLSRTFQEIIDQLREECGEFTPPDPSVRPLTLASKII